MPTLARALPAWGCQHRGSLGVGQFVCFRHAGIVERMRHNWHMAKPALNLTALTTEEKIELIDELWTSIDFGAVPLTPAQRAEIDRRLNRLDEEGPVGIPWEQVRSEMTTKP